MANSKATGISGITGTTVTIRHATDADRVDVLEYLTTHGWPDDGLIGADVVVAAEGERIIGFAVLEHGAGGRKRGCVTVVENAKRRGIGDSVVKHLTEHSRLKAVYAGPDSSRYLSRLGFKKKTDAAADWCVAATQSATLALYERP